MANAFRAVKNCIVNEYSETALGILGIVLLPQINCSDLLMRRWFDEEGSTGAIRPAKLARRPARGPQQLLTNLQRQSQEGDAQSSNKRTCLPHTFTPRGPAVRSMQMEVGVLRGCNERRQRESVCD